MSRRRLRLIDLLKATYPDRQEKELFALILRGDVSVDDMQITKPGASVPSDAHVTARGLSPFVSRGGEKLAHALDEWRIDCAGTVWLDGGCSTGGFTDCLLKRGASLVYAVDVGVNQLDWRLRTDSRVRVMEGTNVMDVLPGQPGSGSPTRGRGPVVPVSSRSGLASHRSEPGKMGDLPHQAAVRVEGSFRRFPRGGAGSGYRSGDRSWAGQGAVSGRGVRGKGRSLAPSGQEGQPGSSSFSCAQPGVRRPRSSRACLRGCCCEVPQGSRPRTEYRARAAALGPLFARPFGRA